MRFAKKVNLIKFVDFYEKKVFCMIWTKKVRKKDDISLKKRAILGEICKKKGQIC